MSALVFVYGTLKRGFCNHRQLAGHKFLGLARTVPGFRLFDLAGFPAIAAWPEDRDGVTGEVWSVDAAGLKKLDAFEGVHEGMYRRELVPLQPPFDQRVVHAYFAGQGVVGRREIGSTWTE